jgi:flagellar assembly protein FliH
MADLSDPTPRGAHAKSATQAASGKEQVAEPDRAWQEEFLAGLAQGRKRAESAADAERSELTSEIIAINEFLEELEQRLTMFALALGLELSRLVLRSAVRIKPDQVAPAVRNALSTLSGLGQQTRLHLNPVDGNLLRQVTGSDPQLRLRWELVDDPTIEPGRFRLVDAERAAHAAPDRSWREVIGELAGRVDWVDLAEERSQSVP